VCVGGRLSVHDVDCQPKPLLNHETNKIVVECVSPAK